jgi:protein-disulfide isomerase
MQLPNGLRSSFDALSLYVSSYLSRQAAIVAAVLLPVTLFGQYRTAAILSPSSHLPTELLFSVSFSLLAVTAWMTSALLPSELSFRFAYAVSRSAGLAFAGLAILTPGSTQRILEQQQLADTHRSLAALERLQLEIDERVDSARSTQDLIAVTLNASRKSQPPLTVDGDPTRPTAPPALYGNSRGSVDAPVQIVVWSNFDCAFCAQANNIAQELFAKYPNDIRYVYKQFPEANNRQSESASLAAIAAGKQGKFFEMHDKLFENRHNLSAEKIEALAAEIGLDINLFKKDWTAPATASIIQRDKSDGANAGVVSTPTFFINGKQPTGRSFELYKSIIDKEIKSNKKA